MEPRIQLTKHLSFYVTTGDSMLEVCNPRTVDADALLNSPPSLAFARKSAVLTAGAGFFTDAYDIFAINLCSYMIGLVYGVDGKLTRSQELGLKIATPVGNLVGQVLFGWLADKWGRKKIYGIELLIMMVATFGQTMAGNGPGVNVFGVLIAWRFIMGQV
ncbi:Inorganic phosphate transporter pho84 [Tulasnella sp. 427]|nr:Inorganic phosphate transporter pho84 [Tulasnella sp. 427]